MKLNIILLFLYVNIFIISCKSDHSLKPVEKNISEKRYKSWLKDTLAVLKSQNNNSHIYSINKDSSSLMIKTKVDTIIQSQKSLVAGSKELKYALSLLQVNKIMPSEKFRLIQVTQYYYDLPFKDVGLLYDFQMDIVNFYIITDGYKKEYKFMKGNLTESNTISVIPNIK